MNIAEILKKCPKGMKLYSPIYGELELSFVEGEHISCITKKELVGSSQAMVNISEVIPMRNVCFSHLVTNAIGASSE